MKTKSDRDRQRPDELRIVVFISLDTGGKLQAACESPTLSLHVSPETVQNLLRLVGEFLGQAGLEGKVGVVAPDTSLERSA
jgi:hypothetical protein